MKKRKKLLKLLILLMIIIIPMIMVKLTDNYFSERTSMYIIKQADNMASNAIKDIVKLAVIPKIDMDKIIIIKYKNDKSIDSVIINTKIINEIMGDASELVDELLSEDILDDTLHELVLPLGYVVSPTLFANKGPKIKIQIRPIGAYNADIYTDVSSYGINNSLIEVYLLIQIDIEALLPLQPKSFVSETKIYLVSQIIQGTIPKYYYGNDTNVDYIPDNDNCIQRKHDKQTIQSYSYSLKIKKYSN